jgi:hypothetical protein
MSARWASATDRLAIGALFLDEPCLISDDTRGPQQTAEGYLGRRVLFSPLATTRLGRALQVQRHAASNSVIYPWI